MSSLKIQRGPVRAAFTKALNEIKAEVDNEEIDKIILQQLFGRLKGHREKLASLDHRIEALLLATDAVTEEDFAIEYESVTDYQDKFVDMEFTVNMKLSAQDNETEPASSVQGSGRDENRKSKYRLPKLEFKKFSGEPREWLGFWSQFRSIHEDEGMAAGEKFQYLVQSTVEKSQAREVIESFPSTAENYPKVIEYLKNRFGRDDVLVEVYVRDLLRLVLRNTVGKDRISISSLYDKLETQLRSLDTLGVTSDKYAAMLYPLVESSLPEETLRAWERNRSQIGQADPTKNRLVHLMEFLRLEVDSEIRIKMAQTGFGEDAVKEKVFRGQRKNQESVPTATELFNGQYGSKSKACIFCDKMHESNDCYKAGKMSLDEKKKIVRDKRGCYNCLKVGHFSSKCFSKNTCNLCNMRHFVVMCPELPQHKQQQVVPVQKDASMANHCASGVLLQTIVVRLKSETEERIVRGIFDSGSQQSYITEKAVEVLGLKPIGETKVTHCLFGGQETQQQTHGRYEVGVMSKNRKFMCKLQVMDSPKICGTISRVIYGPWLNELQKVGIEITDVGDDTPDIHLLIGADLAANLFTGKMYPTKGGPVAMETKLGWTIWGKCLNVKSNNINSSLMVTSLHISDASIQDLWRLDVIGIHDPVETKSNKELMESAQQHFLETVCVNEDGRYEVSLPWVEGHPPLSENKAMAEQRLKSTYKKLEDLKKVEDYQKIFEEWEELGVIERVRTGDVGSIGWYLPHRPVFKPNSLTTPIRPVFDASAKTRNSPSLNDCLEKGPNLIELVPDILTRFRMKRYGVVSDVKKAFLQISVRKEDRDNLRFLWWEGNELRTYRHCRVVFGVSSSPFLLAATINHHLDRVSGEFTKTAQLLKKSLYVDNCIASLDTEEDLKMFIGESTILMEKAKFDLRGWVWNEDEKMSVEATGISSLTSRECGLVAGSLDPEEEWNDISVLGLIWNRTKDTLTLDLREALKEIEGPVTKRRILSAAHRIFDPIGFSSPVSLIPKLLLQEVWKLKTGWDEAVPKEIQLSFISWIKQLPSLAQIEIPRWMVTGNFDIQRCSLHVFTDASKKAYSACVFMRYENSEGVNVQLVMARSRVASTKKMTIPRLELLGCCIGARLASNVKEMIGVLDIPTSYWTDSSNCLYWIQKHENWASFVYNRVTHIRKLSDTKDWRHIPGENNPADLPSRGCSARHLLASRWWEGPDWLKLTSDKWPKSNVQCDQETVMSERVKTVVSQLSMEKEPLWYVKYFSKYRKIVRMLAWILRWKKKVKSAGGHGGPLKMEEEKEAELVLLRLVQSDVFNEKDRAIHQLNAEKDKDGIWRVKTKIIMREDFKDFKFPVLLPFGHSITRMLMEHEHVRMNHCGVQVLMSTLRERFWVIKSRKMAREVISSCKCCKRFTVKNVNPIEAPLPMDRVRDATVFEVTGIDLGGPLYLKNKQKAWFIVFTCAVYRAVHLELVTSLSTEAFLQGLRRFIARRGRPYTIYTDNGTNFEGASNALKKLDWQDITAATSVEQIQWKFNPPSAPWWGGWWERIVGMVKKLLRRILGRASLEYEELQTVLCDCEATINSRPLTYVSEDKDDLSPLTPSMFLNENRGYGVPDIDQLDSVGFNKRFEFRQKLMEDIRRRFREEYLGYLVHRNPMKSNEQTIQVGDVVLVGSDNKKRIQWPMGRVTEVNPGRDGIVRVVKLKTKGPELTRAIQRVYPLEVASDHDTGTWKDLEIEVEEAGNIMESVNGKDKVITTRYGRKVKRPNYLRN